MTEDQFYRTLFGTMPPPGPEVAIPPGDDCAAVRTPHGDLLLLAVDQLVGDRHYAATGQSPCEPEDAGAKLLNRNLSDIAAMGGRAEYALVAIGFPKRRNADWLARFSAGILRAARPVGVHVLGGDLARTPHDDVASLTVVGRVGESRVLRRSGARAGDLLYATGCFGHSFPTGHHLTFTPRCREGAWLAEQQLARAMIDCSDGLLADSSRLADASGVTVRLNPDAPPARAAPRDQGAILGDGEDYELIFAVAPDKAPGLERDWPFRDVPLTRIGDFPQRGRFAAIRPDGSPFQDTPGGFDHFAEP